MSFLNGIGQGLAAFGAAALKDDADQRRSLLNAAPTPAVERGLAAAPAATAATDVPAPASVSGVPLDLLPIYQAASKRTGIPVDVLIAQGKQESGFKSDAVGSAGEIGLHQIKPSTAADPGGMRGIDPATLKDAATNIAFAAEYLKTRVPAGADFNDPAVVDTALRRFNGGGDKNYVANVRRHIGAG